MLLGADDPTAELRELSLLIAAGNTQPGGFYNNFEGERDVSIGQETVNLFGDWVQAVPKNEAQSHAPVPTPRQLDSARPQWRLSEDMMNQK